MLKTTSSSSLRTDLSSNITFSQSQSHATVPSSSQEKNMVPARAESSPTVP
jgi:hypothetical protein